MGIEAINSVSSGSGYQGRVQAPQEELAVQDAAVVSRAGQDFQTESQDAAASENSIKKAVDEINKNSKSAEAVFGYHEGTNRVTIKIVDKDTKEVKKEYPAEKTLDMIQKVWEMAGLMVDEKR